MDDLDAAAQFMMIQLSVVSLLSASLYKHRSRRRRWWVHPINQRRLQQGDYHNLLCEMRMDDPMMFRHYMRMSPKQFDSLLNLTSRFLVKRSNRMPLPPALRLAITLRFLATGDSIPSLAWSYRIGKSTCCDIISETTGVLWDALREDFLPEPSEGTYKEVALQFQELWNLPNCIGAVDGKHVVIQAPNKSGSLFFNYKKSFSIVLLATCDAHYTFLHVNIGAYGSQSDGGIFQQSDFGRKLISGVLPIPQDKPLPHSVEPMPYFFVGDEAFPLKRNLMRPFSKCSLNTLKRKVYNYRHARGRRIIENTFGILVARWRIFHRVINAKPENVDNIIKAAVCLHNYLSILERNEAERMYCPKTFVDREHNGEIHEGEWRQNAPQQSALQHIRMTQLRLGARNSAAEALKIQDRLAEYFMSPSGSIEGQVDYVLRGLVGDVRARALMH